MQEVIAMDSLDDESELTDLEYTSDEEAEVALVKASPRKALAVATEFKLGGRRLNPHQRKEYSTLTLYSMITDGKIDLEPDYQREVVWPQSRQEGIIDSLLRNYYTPPVVLSKSKTEDGFEQRVCVDGKQRLTSIMSFMNGEIPFVDRLNKKAYWYKQPKGLAKRGSVLMPETAKKSFEQIRILCAEYSELSASDEREIFQRVQLGMPLTTPEKWQALQGPWPDFLRSLQDSYFSDNAPGKGIFYCINWATGRAKDFQDIVRIAVAVNTAVLSHTTIPTSTEKIEDIIKSNRPPSEALQLKMLAILEKLLEFVQEKRYKMAFEGKVAPVELVMIAVLIGKRMDKLSDEQLVDMITAMRKDMRKHKGYIMWKPKLIKSMLDFINHYHAPAKAEHSRSPLQAKSKKRKASESSDLEEKTTSKRRVLPKPALPKPSSPNRKRKAPESDSEESEDEPLAKNSLLKPRPSVFKKAKTVEPSNDESEDIPVAQGKNRLKLALARSPSRRDSGDTLVASPTSLTGPADGLLKSSRDWKALPAVLLAKRQSTGSLAPGASIPLNKQNNFKPRPSPLPQTVVNASQPSKKATDTPKEASSRPAIAVRIPGSANPASSNSNGPAAPFPRRDLFRLLDGPKQPLPSFRKLSAIEKPVVPSGATNGHTPSTAGPNAVVKPNSVPVISPTASAQPGPTTNANNAHMSSLLHDSASRTNAVRITWKTPPKLVSPDSSPALPATTMPEVVLPDLEPACLQQVASLTAKLPSSAPPSVSSTAATSPQPAFLSVPFSQSPASQAAPLLMPQPINPPPSVVPKPSTAPSASEPDYSEEIRHIESNLAQLKAQVPMAASHQERKIKEQIQKEEQRVTYLRMNALMQTLRKPLPPPLPSAPLSGNPGHTVRGTSQNPARPSGSDTPVGVVGTLGQIRDSGVMGQAVATGLFGPMRGPLAGQIEMPDI